MIETQCKQIDISAGSVRYRTDASRNGDLITEAKYSGVITAATLGTLREQVSMQVPSTKIYVVRMEWACLAISVNSLLPRVSEHTGLSHGVVVCRADQLEVMNAYAAFMAELGIIRSVFLESKTDLALLHAQWLAQLESRR